MKKMKKGDHYRTFYVTACQTIAELQCTLTELIHEPTGAQVLHIGNDDAENTFCLSFRTTPSSSNGVAHILEHTVLCGSDKFPVKDPFFAMTRRSLNTFMNAMTGADFTCYPAASQVAKDFYHLLDVYLDALFSPKLQEMSFWQEGHRLEFASPQDPTTPLEYKGIVYNEMKGAMSSASSRLDAALSSALFPDSTYGVNSGGDPRVIPTLTYHEFKEFYKQYYHPSRCLFYFYGNLPLHDHLDFIEERLKRAERAEPLQPIARQKRYREPVECRVSYPAGPDDEIDRSYLCVGWLTTHILEVDELLALEILDSALMDTDASPLRHALLKSGLCHHVGSSIEGEISEVPYAITLRGVNPANVKGLETLIFSELKKIAKEGIPKDLIESAMHQMEIERSEITGDSAPYGLTLFWRSALLKQHGGRAEQGLVIHSLFDKLRQNLDRDPLYFSKYIEKYLLNNAHRATIVMTPDAHLIEREEREERERLAEIERSLSAQEKKELQQRAKALSDFQQQQEEQDLSCLPQLTLEDVPTSVRDYPLICENRANLQIFRHSCSTNGLIYAEIVLALPQIEEQDLSLIRLFSHLLSQLGCAGRNYRQNLEYLHRYTGGVGASLQINPHLEFGFTPSMTIRGKALNRNADKLFSILIDMITTIDLSDESRIKELILKHYTSLEASFTSHAMRYALTHSGCKDMASRINYSWFGLDYFYSIQRAVKQSENIKPFIEKLIDLKERLLHSTYPHLVIACEESSYDMLSKNSFYGLTELKPKRFTPWQSNYTLPALSSTGYSLSSPVAFTAKTLSAPTYVDPDAPAINLASHILENTVLHQKIREEGGAYGGGAGYNSAYGHFYFYSYRDPHIAKTIQAFEKSVEELVEGKFDEEDLLDAKLEVIQSSDTPVAPGSRASLAYGWWRCGKTKERREQFRKALLATSKEQVCEAAKNYLKRQEAPIITFASRELLEKENRALKERGISPLSIRAI